MHCPTRANQFHSVRYNVSRSYSTVFSGGNRHASHLFQARSHRRWRKRFAHGHHNTIAALSHANVSMGSTQLSRSLGFARIGQARRQHGVWSYHSQASARRLLLLFAFNHSRRSSKIRICHGASAAPATASVRQAGVRLQALWPRRRRRRGGRGRRAKSWQ